MMMTQRDDHSDTGDLDLAGAQAGRSLGQMLVAMVESENTDFEHERISTSVRNKLFGFGSLVHIGPYPVSRRLGAGGMGEVYECQDERLDRKVAVKLVRGPGGEQHQEALMREAKAMAKLAHPNVVTVFEVGSCGARTFIVMEYIRGQTLADWLRNKPSWRDVVDRFVAAGRGLSAAHRAGLVHRDFKPDNVLLGRDGSVKVTDFGLALTQPQVASRSTGSSPVCGPAAGTTRYMPPEQLRGEPVDARSDQFAFCAALYEGLWHELPFIGLDRKHAKPPKRSHGLWPLVRRGLAARPDDRWPTMEALLSALERVPKRAHRIGWSVTGALVTASLAFALSSSEDVCAGTSHELVGVWDSSRRAGLERYLATLEVSHAKDSSLRVLGSLDTWSSSWLSERATVCRAHSARVGDRAALLSREDCLDHQRDQIRQILDVLERADGATLARGVIVLDEFLSPSTCADSSFSPTEPPPLDESLRIERVRSELDHAAQLRRLGQLEPALQRAQALDAIARTIDYGPIQAEARAELAKAEDEAGTPERSAALYDEAIDLAEIHHQDRLSALLWVERAELSLFDLREPSQGALWLHRAEVAQERVGRPDLRTRARFAFGRARVAELSHDLEAARAAYSKALELSRELGSSELPAYSSNLARVVDSRDESLALRREALAFAESRWGARHPRTAEQLFNLGLALDDAGLGGEQQLATAAEIWTETHGRAHPMLGNAYLALAKAALRRGQLELATDHARMLAAIQTEVSPEGDPGRGAPDQLLALIQGIRGQHEAALAHALVAREWFELAGPDDPRALSMGREAANQLLALGRLEDATRELERVLQNIGEDPAQELPTRVLLAELALRGGRVEDADVQLRWVEALDLPLRDFALSYELLRALVDHRLDRLDPTQLDRFQAARDESLLTDEQLAAWLDELELPREERRLFE